MEEIPQLNFFLPNQFSNNNFDFKLEAFSELLSIDQQLLQNCSIPDSNQDKVDHLF